MGLISLVSISLGIFFNTLILISLPVLNGSDFFGVSLYATSISFADPFNGTLNAEYSFFNLTTLLLGNWGVCFIDYYTYTSSSKHNTLCSSRLGYSVTLSNVYSNVNPTVIPTNTFVHPILTYWMLLHIVSYISYLLAYFGSAGKVRNSAIGFSTISLLFDFGFYWAVKGQFTTQPGITASMGTSIYVFLVALFFLVVAIYT